LLHSDCRAFTFSALMALILTQKGESHLSNSSSWNTNGISDYTLRRGWIQPCMIILSLRLLPLSSVVSMPCQIYKKITAH
jgi:hypothetical protein